MLELIIIKVLLNVLGKGEPKTWWNTNGLKENSGEKTLDRTFTRISLLCETIGYKPAVSSKYSLYGI